MLMASVGTVLITTIAFVLAPVSGAATLIPDSGVEQLQIVDPMVDPMMAFSTANFLLALVVGVVMAFAFQLLLTNFAIAVIATPDGSSHDKDTQSLGHTIRGIETKVGLGLSVSVSLALFIACFLAVKLSLLNSPALGAITGVIIWSVFFTLLTWLGSTAVGSLLGSMISTATTGLQGLLGTGSAILGANLAKNQVVSTAEEITAAVRRELTAGFDPNVIQTTLKSSLEKVQASSLNLDQIGGQFEKLLKDADLGSIADSDMLKNVNRETLVKLVSSRTDLSKKDLNRIVDQLEAAWKKVVHSKTPVDPQAIFEQLKSASPEDLQTGTLKDQLNQVLKTATGQQTSNDNLTARALQFGTTALLGRALQNLHLSDEDVEKIGGKLRTFGSQLLQSNRETSNSSGGSAQPSKPFSIVRIDLENYLLFSPSWKLNQETIQQEFRDVIYDADADPGMIRQEIEGIDRGYFVETLSLRDDLTPERIQKIVDNLEPIRADVLSHVKAAESEAQAHDLRRRVEDYLRSTDKADLNPEAIARNFQLLLEDPEAELDTLRARLAQFDRSTLEQLLSQRSDMTAEEASQLVDHLEKSRDRVQANAQTFQEQLQNQAQELRQKVSDYLRNTHQEELNPEGIQRDLKTLFEDPDAGLSALKSRLAQFDRDTLVQLLSQRQDLSEEQVNQVLDQIESVRQTVLQAPQKLADKTKAQYEQTTQALADYLRNTNLEELDPDGLQRDLSTLLSDPKAGASALKERLSHVDRETLVKLLSQRDDLTEEQVNHAIDKIQASLRSVVKAPRRLANRVQQKAVDFESNLESYLRNTNKEELNPEGIKNDLRLLLQDPRTGLSSLGDRAAQFDRETFVALLAQRKDMTEDEANRIADQLESNFKAVVSQIQKVQQAVQSTIDRGFENVRTYLNGLERPELNYDGIKHDFSTLFNDPQMGVEALRDRLTQFDRNTLVAVLSSRDDISEADANRIIDQVETARDSVLHQIERVQQETQKRLDVIKYATQKQIRETRKVAAGAAWWVFSAAVFSLAASASAGFVAVSRVIVP
jgi:uncharacterized membrane protein YedE/YeeE